MKEFISKKDLNYLSTIGWVSPNVIKKSDAEKAIKRGEEVWIFSKGYGKPIYYKGSRKDAEQYILKYYNIPKFPKDWYLDRVTSETLKYMDIDPNVE
jgi:hypothetical protein